jgi:hypothetical protein
VVKRRKLISSIQGDLFQQLAEQTALEAQQAQDLDINLELMGAINQAIREAKQRGMSRERIIDRMNLCLPDLERGITLRQLNAWTAQSKEYHEFPARYLPAFCWATGSVLPLLMLAQAIGHDLVDRRDQVALELGQKLVAQAQLTRDVNSLKKLLGDK